MDSVNYHHYLCFAYNIWYFIVLPHAVEPLKSEPLKFLPPCISNHASCPPLLQQDTFMLMNITAN